MAAVKRFYLTDCNTQDSSTYKSNIDADAAYLKQSVLARDWSSIMAARGLHVFSVYPGGEANQVQMGATDIIMTDGNNRALFSGMNEFSINMNSSGANGRQTGLNRTTNTWYYIYMLGNATNGNVAGLFSNNRTAPSLPAGYDFYALVSAVRTDGNNSGDIIPISQRDYRVNFLAQGALSSANSGNAIIALDLRACIPDVAKQVSGIISSSAVWAILYSSPQLTGIGKAYVGGNGVTAPFSLPVEEAQYLYWQSYTGNMTVQVSGWEF